MSKRKKQEMKDYLKKMENPHRTLEKRKKDHHRTVTEEHPRRIPILKKDEDFLGYYFIYDAEKGGIRIYRKKIGRLG